MYYNNIIIIQLYFICLFFLIISTLIYNNKYYYYYYYIQIKNYFEETIATELPRKYLIEEEYVLREANMKIFSTGKAGGGLFTSFRLVQT